MPLICKASEEPKYDIIDIFLKVRQVGNFNVPALILGKQLYLPVNVIFDLLKIKNNPSATMDTVTGFLINPQATFIISKPLNRITYNGEAFNLNPDCLIREEGGLYLRSDYFGRIFGLTCTFNFRALSAGMDTRLDLPVIREMRQEMMRSNIRKLKRERKADTTIRCEYPLFRLGVADWGTVVTHQLQGNTDARLNLSLGAALAGGDATVALSYQNNYRFDPAKQYYLWRYVDNDQRFLRQMKIGTIPSQAVSTILAPVLGVQFTNTPTTYRQSFGTYRLSKFTEPNWIVELYVNNVLVNYTRADASGFFTFEIPLVYGNSTIQLRFYGPWGEERSSEENIVIPFTLVPQKELEYTVSTGQVMDKTNGQLARVNLNYGLSRYMTVGGGIEYLSSITSSPFMPFVNTTFKVASNLLVSAEYMHHVRSKGVISYRLPSDLQLELDYIRYAKGQQAINNRSFEERKAIVSVPLRTPGFVMFSRLTLSQIISPQTIYDIKTRYSDIPKTRYTSAELMLTSAFRSISTSLTTYGLFIGDKQPYLYSDLSLAFRLPAGFIFKPQARYDYEQSKFMTARAELEKQLSGKGFLNIAYEKNFYSRFTNFMIGMSLDLSFIRTAFSASRTNQTTTLIQSAAGSLLYNNKAGYTGMSSRSGIGRAGIIIIPYLDINANHRRDASEPKVAGLHVRVNDGRIATATADTTIPVLNLEPYISHYIELDDKDLGNIAWQVKTKTYNITVGANQLKSIEVPVAVAGEVSGMVYLKKEGKERKGQGRIIVAFYNKNSKLVGKTLTEPDGFFSYLGLPPGSYTARIDEKQLSGLQLVSSAASLPFTIVSSTNGAIVEGLEFTISPSSKDTLARGS
jgi:hypothetical protein